MKRIVLLSFAVLSAVICLFLVFGAFGKPSQDDLDKRLLSAVLTENKNKFDRLLVRGADPNRIFGHAPNEWVMCAVTQKGKLNFLKEALQKGGDPDLRNPSASRSVVKSIFSAPLLCAIRHHNDAAFVHLLAIGVKTDIRACQECRLERQKGSPVTVAESGNEYRMVLDLIAKRNGNLREEEIRYLIRGIEETTINENSEENDHRLELAQWIQSLGYSVTPWCRQKCKQ